MGARERFGDQRDGVVLRSVLPQVGEREAESRREHSGEIEVVDRAELDEELAQSLARGGLLQQGLVQPARADELALDQEFTESRDAAAGYVFDRIDGRNGRL